MRGSVHHQIKLLFTLWEKINMATT